MMLQSIICKYKYVFWYKVLKNNNLYTHLKFHQSWRLHSSCFYVRQRNAYKWTLKVRVGRGVDQIFVLGVYCKRGGGWQDLPGKLLRKRVCQCWDIGIHCPCRQSHFPSCFASHHFYEFRKQTTVSRERETTDKRSYTRTNVSRPRSS